MRALAVGVMVSVVGCGTDDDQPPGSSPGQMLCVSETNRYRASRDRPELAYSRELEVYATEGAQVDFGSAPHEHFESTNGGGIALAENECPQQGNWRVPDGVDVTDVVRECIATFFDEGPGGGHYDNMMGPYGTIGCGIYQSQDRITIVQDFGP